MGVTYTGWNWWQPRQYRNAMVFGDYALGCVWSKQGASVPTFLAMFERHTVRAFETNRYGDVYFTDHRHGSIRKFDFGNPWD